MAYNKKYAELGESVIDYVNDREDAIEQGFDTLITGGTNSNGSWTKFPDGTMECFKNVSVDTTINTLLDYHAFPINFVGEPYVSASIPDTTAIQPLISFRNLIVSTSNQRWVIRTNPVGTQTITVRLYAIGRWK